MRAGTETADRETMGRNKYSAPRRVGGGRSARHEEKRAYLGSKARYCVEWSDAAAAKVMQCLEDSASANGETLGVHTLSLMTDLGKVRALITEAQRSMSMSDRALVAKILLANHERIKQAVALDEAGGGAKGVHSMLKPLRERRKTRAAMAKLSVPHAPGPRGTFPVTD